MIGDDGEGDHRRRRRTSPRKLLLRRRRRRLDAIDAALFQLSDGSHHPRTCGDRDRRRGDGRGASRLPPPPLDPGLETQYRRLRALLKRGLLGAADAGDIEKRRGNVAAVLMGPRGHGKSLVLERCLADLRVSHSSSSREEKGDGADSTKKRRWSPRKGGAAEGGEAAPPPFRVVRLNGLLVRGDDAVACARELARELNNAALHHGGGGGDAGGGEDHGRRRRRRIDDEDGNERRPSGVAEETKFRDEKEDDGGRSASTTAITIAADGGGIDGEGTPPPGRATAGVAGGNDGPDRSLRSTPASALASMYRIRKSGFASNVALLDESLRTARVDGVPVLVVLEELDSFLDGSGVGGGAAGDGGDNDPDGGSGGNDRQLLLYHLLDRVADHSYLLSVVGITSNLGTLGRFEKRVKSRAEGTSDVLYFGPPSTYSAMAQSLLGKFVDGVGGGENDVESASSSATEVLRSEIESLLLGDGSNEANDDEDESEARTVRRILERSYEIGRDARWFCRVLSVALSLLAGEVLSAGTNVGVEDGGEGDVAATKGEAAIAKLTPRHLIEALAAMGAGAAEVDAAGTKPRIGSGGIGGGGVAAPSSSTAKDRRSIAGEWGGGGKDAPPSDPRVRAMSDLSGPQVAVLLAAKRIVTRDETRASAEDAVDAARRGQSTTSGAPAAPSPLTYRRIADEYLGSFVASGRYTTGSDRYPPAVLRASFVDLVEADLIRLCVDHSGGGAMQYDRPAVSSIDALSPAVADAHPLNVNLDWEREVAGPLRAGSLDCSTALREWGMKMN